MALGPKSLARNAGDPGLAIDAQGKALRFDQRGPGYSRVIIHVPKTADFRSGVTCLIDTQLCVCLHANPRAHRPRPISVRGPQGQITRTDRPCNHGTGSVGFVSPASFSSGLWARLLRRTMISLAVTSTNPGVSTNFRNNRDGPARANPLSRSAKLRYSRSASTVNVRSKSTFSRTSLH